MGDCNKQLTFQFGAAFNFGISRQVIQEVLIQLAVFSGNTCAINAALILHQNQHRQKANCRNKNFRFLRWSVEVIDKKLIDLWLFIISDTALNIGLRIFQFYCAWMFIQKFQREDFLSTILIGSWMATVFLMPLAGASAERNRKSPILLIGSLLSLLAISLILITILSTSDGRGNSHINISLFLAAIFLAVLQTFTFPLGAAIIPKIMCGEEMIQYGFKIKSSMYFANILFGPTLGGAAIGWFGGAAAVKLSLAAYFISSISAVAFAWRFKERPLRKNGVLGIAPTLVGEAFSGFRIVYRIPAERMIAIGSMIVNFLLTPFLTLLLPAMIIHRQGTMVEVAVVELSVGAGILLAATFGIKVMRRQWSVFAISMASIILIVVSVCSIAMINSPIIVALLAFLLGHSMAVWNVSINTKRAVSIPEGYRALLESSLMFLCIASVPIALVVCKVLLVSFDPSVVIFCLALPTVPGIFILFLSASFRDMVNSVDEGKPYYSRHYAKFFRQEDM